MSESLRATLGGVIFLGIIASLTVWVAVGIPETPLVWSLRVLLPLTVVAAAAALLWAYRRHDVAPDFIRQLLGQPFERDGACFSIFPTAREGVCVLNIVFQNQYEGAAHVRMVVQPPVKSFTFGKRPFPGISIDVYCDGGAFGVARVPIAIPGEFQGARKAFEVAAATQYPTGRGKLLRFRNGLRVGKAETSGLGSAAVTLGLLAVGVARRPATAFLPLPTNVAESLPPDSGPDVQTLWRPGDDAAGVAKALRCALTAPEPAMSHAL